MDSITAAARDFLRAHGMSADGIDLERECVDYVKAMERGLDGRDSSLYMIPTYITADGEVPLNQKVITLDAGGTNFRVASVYFNDNGEPVIDYFRKYPMPGSEGVIDIVEFFDTVAEYLLPVLDESDRIGFCFSYVAEILPDRDGRLVNFCKEVEVTNSAGALICDGVKKALERRGIDVSNKRFSLLNDTVASMLGGRAAQRGVAYESYIGFVLGTGTNSCYLERSECVTKSPEAVAMGGRIAINTESCCYTGLAQGDYEQAVDLASANPGDHMLEKMISGAYQGKVIFETLKGAAAEGLFTPRFVDGLSAMETLTLREIDDFCYAPFGQNTLARLVAASDADRLTLYAIIDESYERAAKVVTLVFAGILQKTGFGKDPTRPVCVAAEGTTFYKSKLFRGKLDYYVKSFINARLGAYLEFVHTENATLVGTAVAGLLN